jgi:ribosomal-protein-alanine N-acetyltransferase
MKASFGDINSSHIARIVEIENQSFQEPWSFEGFRELIANPSFASMGIFLNQKLVGYIFYYLVMDELHVMNVAIDPAFRKKGLGESLLNKVHDKGKKHSIKFAYLEVRETNESAQKLYEKLGYRKQGRRIGYYSNKEDALLMFKDLS